MSGPPGIAPTTTDRRNHERRAGQPAEELIRDTHRVLLATGITRSSSWVVRTVRTYVRHPEAVMPYGMYLAARLALSADRRARLVAADPEPAYLLDYADPTGETATHNVDREPR